MLQLARVVALQHEAARVYGVSEGVKPAGIALEDCVRWMESHCVQSCPCCPGVNYFAEASAGISAEKSTPHWPELGIQCSLPWCTTLHSSAWELVSILGSKELKKWQNIAHVSATDFCNNIVSQLPRSPAFQMLGNGELRALTTWARLSTPKSLSGKRKTLCNMQYFTFKHGDPSSCCSSQRLALAGQNPKETGLTEKTLACCLG